METIEARITTPAAAREAAPSQPPSAPRHDCYAGIHKALRLGLCRTLVQVGSTDPQDEADVAAAVAAVRLMVEMSESHLDKEDTYMHPLLERARPGSTAHADDEHHHHHEALAQLRVLARRVEDARPASRPQALARLYRALTLFMAQDLAHMHREETEHNAVLWAHYSDAELLAVEQRIVASIPPDVGMRLLHWFMPAFSAPERLGMLGGIRMSAPAPVFAAACGVAAEALPQREFAKLAQGLGIAPAPGLVSAARG
jgi:hypothetical protein